MSSQPEAFDLPQRHSLSTQCATAMRQAIDRGTWRDTLPGERRLCELFQVSRPTIRTALEMLAKAGMIEIRHGRRNRLLSSSPRKPRPKSRLIVLVSHQPIEQSSVAAYQGISEMRTDLAKRGFTTEVLICQMRSAKARQRKIETFIRENHVFCCVLISLSKELQHWFAVHSIPALVLGSCHPSVKLPSLDVDYRSVCRHAAGVFLRQGHRRLALIVPDSGVAGDLASEAGFREGCANNGGAKPIVPIIVRPTSAGHIAVKLDPLFSSAHPPTALLVAKPVHILAVLVYLLKRGVKVPDAVSLIGRDWDPLFENSLSHYRFESETFGRRLSQLMARMMSQSYLPPVPHFIFPRFVAGGTVKAVSASA